MATTTVSRPETKTDAGAKRRRNDKRGPKS